MFRTWIQFYVTESEKFCLSGVLDQSIFAVPSPWRNPTELFNFFFAKNKYAKESMEYLGEKRSKGPARNALQIILRLLFM